jgi:hypothetical protein
LKLKNNNKKYLRILAKILVKRSNKIVQENQRKNKNYFKKFKFNLLMFKKFLKTFTLTRAKIRQLMGQRIKSNLNNILKNIKISLLLLYNH